MKTKIKDLLQAALAELEQEDKPAWTLTRHLPGFRALRDGEEWHRQDFTEDMLAGGWRPLLLGETTVRELDEYCHPGGPLKWKKIYGLAGEQAGVTWSGIDYNTYLRTRRPLPEPAKVVPWGGQDDFPVNCWLRHKQIPQVHYRPFSAEPLGVAIFYTEGKILNWQVLADWYEHSFNCKTWFPCTKEVAP